MKKKILIVDDQVSVAKAHKSLVESLGYETFIETDPRRVYRLLSEKKFDLVLLDFQMPHLNGLQVLRRIVSSFPKTGVIMATVVNDIQNAVRAIKDGAFNYLVKPLDDSRVAEVLSSYFESIESESAYSVEYPGFIARSKKFTNIFRRIRAFAEAGVDVFIEGETGTGKDLVARIIHNLSRDSQGLLVPVNVAALSQSLFESELFGHKRGAFTSAVNDHDGYLALAEGGSLFLDEIGELALEQQVKLLRVLQNRSYTRVGDIVERELMARVITATNRVLREEVERGFFREDLYFRLASHSIQLPPLRERIEDIEPLANHFFRKYSSQYGRKLTEICPKVIEVLEQYRFPGNIRELEGLISCAVLLEQKPILSLDSFPRTIMQKPEVEGHDIKSAKLRSLLDAMAACQGNQTKAAVKLGVARSTLARWVKEYRTQGYDL